MKSPRPCSSTLPVTWIWRRIGSSWWQVNSEFLHEPFLNRLGDPETLMQPPARMLRQRRGEPTTEVVSLAVPELHQTLIIKRFQPRNAWQRFRNLFRRGPARRAFELALRLQAHGLDTAVPVAAMSLRAPWRQRSFLLTVELPSARSLHEFNTNVFDDRDRRGGIKAFGRMIAALHDLHYSHSDPSLTNFLAVRAADASWRLFLIDLDGLRPIRLFRTRRIFKDLRRFSARALLEPTERLWFLSAYCRARRAPLSVRQLRQALQAKHAVDSSVKRGDFGLEQAGGMQWVVRRPRLNSHVRTILEAPDDFLEKSRVFKPSRSSAVSGANGVVVKRYNYREWISRVKDGFRPGRGSRCFLKAYLLEIAGIPTARPIAAAERRRCRLVIRSYFIMEEVPGARPLGDWPGDKHSALVRVAELLAQLHAAGFSHRDLKDGNIVFDANQQPRFIDLDGLCYLQEISDSRAAADLARLEQNCRRWRPALSWSDRLRFLKRYSQVRKSNDWRWWWRAIAEKLASSGR